MEFNTEIKTLTDPIFNKISKVVPEIEWKIHAPLIHKINKLKKEKNAVILAHNYQTPEIFHGIADFASDSLALAIEASKTKADIIVMCGVHFMAETVKLMNPSKKVLLPDMSAGCSLSSSITGKDVRILKKKYPLDSSRLYEILGHDIVLYDHFNDINIIKPLKNLFGEKNIFKLAQQVRIDISPDYYHALRWHQDHFDFSSMKSSAISLNINYKDSYTVWSPFTKADQSIGTMEVLVGSHKYRRLNHNYDAYAVSDSVELKIPKNILNKCRKKTINVNKSQSIIFSMNLIHRTVIGKSRGIRLTGWGRFTSTNSSSFENMIKYV